MKKEELLDLWKERLRFFKNQEEKYRRRESNLKLIYRAKAEYISHCIEDLEESCGI